MLITFQKSRGFHTKAQQMFSIPLSAISLSLFLPLSKRQYFLGRFMGSFHTSKALATKIVRFGLKGRSHCIMDVTMSCTVCFQSTWKNLAPPAMYLPHSSSFEPQAWFPLRCSNVLIIPLLLEQCQHVCMALKENGRGANVPKISGLSHTNFRVSGSQTFQAVKLCMMPCWSSHTGFLK